MTYSTLDKPESIPQVFTEAWNNRDAQKLASLFDEDAEFINVTGLWWHNRKDIEKAHDYGLRAIFNNSTLSLIRTKVKYLKEDVAVVQAKMKLTGQSATAGVDNPGLRRNIFTFVVHKMESEWSCASAQNTDIVPNMETHIRDEAGNLIPVDYRKKNYTQRKTSQDIFRVFFLWIPAVLNFQDGPAEFSMAKPSGCKKSLRNSLQV